MPADTATPGQTAPAEPPRDAPARLEWVSLPLVDDRPRSYALVGIVLALPLGIALSFEGAGWGALSFALLLLMLAPYFAPTRYALDAEGARATFLGRTTRRRWSEVRALYRHADGVHLSPFTRPSPLDPFRGLFLRFTRNRAEVLAFLARAPLAAPAKAPVPAPTPASGPAVGAARG